MLANVVLVDAICKSKHKQTKETNIDANLCAFFSKKLLRPLKELETTIEAYMICEGTESPLKFHDDYGIREYIELKAFIKKAFISLNEKISIAHETSTLAASVSHDIASPLAVMEMTMQIHTIGETGLTLLENIQTNGHRYLITNAADEASVQERAMLHGIWLIPKNHIHEIPLKFNTFLSAI